MKISAASAITVDAASGKILYQKNPEQILPLASITKLMTAIIFLENNPGWDKEYTIAKEDARAGAKASLLVGDTVTVRDLFYAMMVASSNEGAIALANSTGLGQEEFVSK